ncbi:MAG: aminotransferase class IV [Myxococcales bacterium]|nr:aminotransferase class IV [Myxococcales bacterium]
MIPATDVGWQRGWTVFETLRVVDGGIPLLEEHVERLAKSAEAMRIRLADGIADEARQLAGLASGESRIRITVSGTGHRVLTIEPVPPDRRGAPIRAATGPWVADPFLAGSVKHGSRAGWVVAVLKAGVDEVLLVDGDGRFTEGTTSGILAVVDGRIHTAPHDDRILQSTTVCDALRVAEQLGFAVVREGALAGGPFDALYIASATRGLSPVVELDGRPLPAWDPVGRAVFEAM